MAERRWQYAVPNDILSHISDFLPLQDWINFRGVCRSWREAPSRRSNITEFSKTFRWCIFYDCDCYFYQQDNPKSFSLRLPMLRGATCLMSKYGWLLIRRRNVHILFNPLTHAEILLPQYPTLSMESLAHQMGTFSALPTDTECIVIIVSSIDSSTILVAYCCVTDNQWIVEEFNTSNSIDSAGVKFMLIYNVINEDRFVDYHFLLSVFWEDYLNDKQYEIEHACWFMWMRDVHLDNWPLCKFKKEFTISFFELDACKRILCRSFYDERHWIVADTNSATVNDVNAPVIKATWIEAAFPVSKKPESALLDVEDA